MPLRLRTAAALARPDPHPYEADAEILDFYRDLLGDRHHELDEAHARHGTNVPFTELADRALRAAPGPSPHPDLLVLAYAGHDLDPLTTVASQLDHRLGGGSRSFAVSEQGLGAPFTALRIAAAYARSGRCHSAALFVLEQTTYSYPQPFARGLCDSGVYLLFDDTAEDGWAPTSLRTGDLGQLLPSPDSDTLLVAGPWVDPALVERSGLSCHRVQPGSYATSVWAALATHHRQWSGRYSRLVLCDTDVRRGVSHVALLTASAAETPQPVAAGRTAGAP